MARLSILCIILSIVCLITTPHFCIQIALPTESGFKMVGDSNFMRSSSFSNENSASSETISNVSGIWYLRHLKVRHDQTSGDIGDWIGSLRKSPPDAEEYRYCGEWTDFFLDENLSGSQTFDNIYFHIWTRSRENKSMNERLGWHYADSIQDFFITNWSSAHYFDQVTKYALSTHILDIGCTWSESESYRFKVRHEILNYGMPLELSSPHFQSFVIINIPDNETLNSTGLQGEGNDTDMDGLTDWQEVYKYFTNPFDKDTDHDLWNDSYEVNIAHTNPNNWDADDDDLADGIDYDPMKTRYTYFNGDWIITENTTKSTEEKGYIMNGNITIRSGKSLTLDNFNIIFNTTNEKAVYKYHMILEDNAVLRGRGLLRTNNGNKTSSIKLGDGAVVDNIETRYVKIEVNGNWCTVKNSTLIGNEEFASIGITYNHNNNLVLNNTFNNTEEGVDIFKAHNNTIRECKFWYSNHIISLSYGDYNALLNSTVFGCRYSIYIRGAKYMRIENISITDSKSGPFLISTDNTMINNISIHGGPYGVKLDHTTNSFVERSTFERIKISFYCDYSTKTELTNVTIRDSTTSDIRLYYSNITLLNTTSDQNKVWFTDTSSKLFVKWFLHVDVVDEYTQPIGSATVRIQENNNGSLDENYTTNLDGLVRWIVCTQYFQNKTKKIYCTPHTITATKNNTSNQTTVNMNNSKEIIITLNMIPRSPTNINSQLEGENLKNINITWNLSIDDGGGQNDVVGYDIYYNKTYNADGIGYILLDSVGTGTSYHIHANGGNGDSNNYFYYVVVKDENGNTNSTTNQTGKFVRHLECGWQLISIPLIQSDTNITKVLQTVDWDIARWYDPLDDIDPWKCYARFKPQAHNDLYNFDHKMALWVNVTEDSNLTVAGCVPMSTTINLHTGYNFVSYACLTNQTVQNALEGADYKQVEGYNKSRLPYYLETLEPIDQMCTGYGYWIYSLVENEWTVYN